VVCLGFGLPPNPRQGINVSSRRCNLRIDAKEEKENSPERAEHRPMEGLFDPFRVAKNTNVNESRRLHLRLLL